MLHQVHDHAAVMRPMTLPSSEVPVSVATAGMRWRAQICTISDYLFRRVGNTNRVRGDAGVQDSSLSDGDRRTPVLMETRSP